MFFNSIQIRLTFVGTITYFKKLVNAPKAPTETKII